MPNFDQDLSAAVNVNNEIRQIIHMLGSVNALAFVEHARATFQKRKSELEFDGMLKHLTDHLKQCADDANAKRVPLKLILDVNENLSKARNFARKSSTHRSFGFPCSGV